MTKRNGLIHIVSMPSNYLRFNFEIDFDHLKRFRWAQRMYINTFHQKNENYVVVRGQMYALFSACFYIQSKLEYMRFFVACTKRPIHIVLKARNNLRFGMEVVKGISKRFRWAHGIQINVKKSSKAFLRELQRKKSIFGRNF